MLNNLKNKIRNNLPAIAAVTTIAAGAGIIIAVSVTAHKRAAEAAKVHAAIVDALNAGLASGEYTTIFDKASGMLTVVDTASL